MNGLGAMHAIVSRQVPPPPIAELIGLELVEVRPGEAVFALQADRRHANPMGTLHGGVLCDLGDAAMGCAVATTLAEGESYTTLELKINFFKPVWQQRLRATGKVVKRTRKLAYTEADVVDETGSLVAKLNGSCLVLSGGDAQGR
ncbi:MAG TPA: PaaI family thioesterase [Polyangia bacterium]|jgi:uncharacterized protein (TIGR00369 family)